MRKRIEFSKIKVLKSEIADENTGGNGENNPGSDADMPDCGVEFRLYGENLGGYGPQYASVVTDEMGNVHPAMGGWPEAVVAFNVSEVDIPRVLAWFNDDYQGVTAPESALLQKNRSAAVHAALKGYLDASASSNLFTSPFRLGWCYLFTDGSRSALHDIGVMRAFMSAPRLPIVANGLTDKYLHTRAQIRNVPARLQCRFIPDVNFLNQSGRIAGIEVFATEQAPMYDKNANVAGIRSITLDGTPKRCWQYDHYTEQEVMDRAEGALPFRRIASISYDEIGQMTEFTSVPLSAGTLSGFTKQPSFDSLTESEGNEPPIAGASRIRLLTEPLHLDYPEDEKSVRNVTLRGVFPRDNVKFKLYGSQHREKWHLLASARGAYIRGIRGIRLRWLRVEIECDMREGDFFEAVTFEFSL